MLNSTTVHVWSTCYSREVKQKFPFFSEDRMQNKDDLKNLCIDLNKILLRLRASLCPPLRCICLFCLPSWSHHDTRASWRKRHVSLGPAPLVLAFWHMGIYPAWMFTVLLCYSWTSIIFNKKETNSIWAGMQLSSSVTMWTRETWKEQQFWKDHTVTDKHSGSCPVKFRGLTSGSFKLSYSNDFSRVALLSMWRI